MTLSNRHHSFPKRSRSRLGLCLNLSFLLATIPTAQAEGLILPGGKNLSIKAKLGQQLFFDNNLSNPAGQSCSSCHDPSRFFTDPDNNTPTSQGVLSNLKGNRNTPTLLYASYSPKFHFDRAEGLYIGGQFLDGRAATLTDQAKGPFLNALEMANPDAATVVAKVRLADYAAQFDKVYGKGALNDNNKAYNRIADALKAFEQTPIFKRFTSKYDYFLAGKVKFTEQEKRGRQLFESAEKGNCAACHPSRPAKNGTPPLFTDYSYDNLGVPKNPDNEFYSLPADLNPAQYKFVDKGLGNFLHLASENGKFKVPSLRNVAVTAPYTHNGYFKTLRGVVDFYNSRDLKPACPSAWVTEANAIKNGCWPAPEVKQNVNVDELGMLGLDDAEITDIIAFLKTLTDGYPLNKN